MSCHLWFTHVAKACLFHRFPRHLLCNLGLHLCALCTHAGPTTARLVHAQDKKAIICTPTSFTSISCRNSTGSFQGTWPAPPYSPAIAGGGAPLGFVNGCTLCPYTIFESKDWGIRVSIRETHQLQLAPAPGDLRICSSAYVSQVLHHEAHGIRKWSMQRYLMRVRDNERE